MHNFLIFILVCIVILRSYQILCVFFKRILFYIHLKIICRNTGAKLYPTHMFWLFGGQYTGIADFHIETENNIYSVKFWGALKYKKAIDFIDSQTIAVRDFHASGGGLWATGGWGTAKIKKIHEIYFNFNTIDNPHYFKRRIPVLLFLPTPMLVTENVNNHKYAGILKREKEFTMRTNGDMILNRFYLFSAKSFLDVVRLNASEFAK